MHSASSTNLPSQHTVFLTGQIEQVGTNSITLNSRRLNWYPATPLPQVGETWRVEARLRPLRSLHNFAVADFSAASLALGQFESGYITQNAQVTKLKDAKGLNAWRNNLIQLAQQHQENQQQPENQQQGWNFMLALGLGAKNLLPTTAWQTLELTGTVHLWVVSGLHLGLLAGLIVLIGRKLHWNLGITLSLALALALGYAHLAGWGVAAQRSALMLLIGYLVVSGWRQLNFGVVFSFALLILLISNPLVVLSKGFWLSFGAVAVLLLAFYGRTRSNSIWLGLVKVQLVLLLAFTPILVWQGAWFNLWAVPINLVLVPLVGLLLLPATLLALAISTLGWYLPLEFIAYAFNWVAQGLNWAAKLSHNTDFWWGKLNKAYLQQPAYLWLGLLALLPQGMPIRHLAWLGIILAFLPQPLTNTDKLDWHVRVLDVGQGTAVLVESGGEKLLYDTGRGYPSGWAPVVMAIEPWLNPQGLNQLVISHDDVDHAGGKPALANKWLIEQEYSAAQNNCYAGETWQLGTLDVIALWPPRLSPEPSTARLPARADNADSCVLLIKAPEINGRIQSLLLTGDAGVPEEAYFSQALPQLLTTQAGRQEQLSLLITGHHGSNTSTGAALLQATQPIYAVHTNGWRNTYGHPHALVVQRLRQVQAQQFSTASHGAVHFHLQPSSNQTEAIQVNFKQHKPALWDWLSHKAF